MQPSDIGSSKTQNWSSHVPLRRALVPTLIAGVIAAISGAVFRGSSGLIGALIGALIVIVFFSIGQVVLNRVIENNPSMAMSVAMLMYLIKIGVLFVLLLIFKSTTIFDTKVFALTILLCTLVWTAAETWAHSNARVLYVEPGNTPENVPSITDND